MLAVLTDYAFLTVAVGTLILALASSMVGTITVLTKQSLIGDMLGHAAYPGVVFAFMVFQSRQPLLLMLGAMLSGYVSYRLVYWIANHRRQSLINALALVSAAFFGLGMVLKQFVQGNPTFANSSQAGLQTYLFGQAAFIKKADVILIIGVSVVCLALYGIYYQRYRLMLFDPVHAQLSGVSVKTLDFLTRLMMIALISVGLKVVGAILMSAFLIAPASLGLLWGKTYGQSLRLAAALASVSALTGSYISSLVSGMSTGPSIIVTMSAIALMIWTVKRGLGRSNHV
ncbi:manganese/zinc/iron transport system permease protein [Streptococcus moroccensis]|uniref:Manganese/zinc/iron transport system permease protein n=1 Tax=Streptococcus moroccensis TaxID=1451356 RepID=A0ABT9YU54_9STRE|nr:metal ABC transporter permease [Streptococcus moroccensis]MDQ0223457.1 manganese/zinc/iron transport system permease protein [Streptococcus moroccensis]